MKHSHHILRTLQALTVITMIVIVVLLLALFDVFPKQQTETPERNAGSTQEIKINRPRTVKNLSYQEYLQQGDQAKYKLNFDAALAAYQQAAKLEPREFAVYEKTGDVYFLQKKYDSALENYQLADSLNTQKSLIKIKIVRTLLELRKVVDAKTKAEAIQPETQESVYYQGLIAAFLNDQAKAKDLLQKSITIGSDEALKANVKKILTDFQDFELAKEAPIEFLQAMLAQSFDQAGEYGMAIELAFNALKTQHDYRDVWIVLGHAFLNEQKWFDAEDALTKAIALDSSHPASYFFRGIAKRNLGKYAESAADLQKALKLGWKPQILAKQYIADDLFDTKDFAKAFPIYKEIVTSDSNDINHFIRPMALAINQLNKPTEALELANLANKTHPGTAMAVNLLGWALLANNDFKGSHENLAKALKLDPNLGAAHLNLGQLFEREGNREAALTEYQTASDLAEKSMDESIGNTASFRYNELMKNIGTPLTSPQTTKTIPSLSLQ